MNSAIQTDCFHILALSGGGFKGLFTATVLEELENDFGHPIAKKFDLIAGTSIGGIIALALALEIPAKEIKAVFIENGEKIFSRYKNIFHYLSNGYFLYSKYENIGLRECLKTLFGDKKIGGLKHRIIVPTVNYTKGSPQVLKTRHHKSFKKDIRWDLVDAAQATSAAPYYFPFFRNTEGDFIDGGIAANHPGLFAVIEAQQFLDIPLNNIYQLHIGTLSQKFTSSGKYDIYRSGLMQWNKRIIDLLFSSQERSSDQILKFLLKERYNSIDNVVTDEQAKSIGLDKVSETSKRILTQCANVESQAFLGSEFYSIIKNHNAPEFIPIPLEQGE
ncbi:hypothetical protein FACS189485_15400 [Spirochaetia bacterium]|nr:hypothetical protein FACS189485_15400 [Spirochaetia bacterium]